MHSMSSAANRSRRCSELEVASGGGTASNSLGLARGQQAHHSSQVFPGGLVQGWVGADQVADHVPCRQVEGAFRGRPHGQGDGALRAKTDALRRRLLPRPDTDRLREHIYRDGFMSDFDLAITAQAKQVFQKGPFCQSKGNTVSWTR